MNVAPRRGRTLIALALCGLSLLTMLSGCRSSSQGAGGDSGSRTIENKGSDTLVNLALAWVEAYGALHPDVRISVTGGGSGTGIAAMINGTVDTPMPLARCARGDLCRRGQRDHASSLWWPATPSLWWLTPDNPVDQLTLAQVSISIPADHNWSRWAAWIAPSSLLCGIQLGHLRYFLETCVRMGDAESNLLFSPDRRVMPSSGDQRRGAPEPQRHRLRLLGYVTSDKRGGPGRLRGGP
jgi:phosphate transport system substrate-binding protein